MNMTVLLGRIAFRHQPICSVGELEEIALRIPQSTNRIEARLKLMDTARKGKMSISKIDQTQVKVYHLQK